ncbi:hypothetical protein [Brachyspira intermedia]|uniref:hypothetical protein n=1 Tax=Brachyspira intermedia TaxID=84377 RepID=UPI00300610CF
MTYIKLNKEYKDEIVYETMLKMGFLHYFNTNYYYNNKGIQFKNDAEYTFIGLFLSFDNNILTINHNHSILYLSEFLTKHNITKLTDIEPSSLIDVEYEGKDPYYCFAKLNNITQKVIITFIAEFDRIYSGLAK